MDSKDDEQARGITMKSSSISLLFVPGAATRPDGPNSVPRDERLAKGGRGGVCVGGAWGGGGGGRESRGHGAGPRMHGPAAGCSC